MQHAPEGGLQSDSDCVCMKVTAQVLASVFIEQSEGMEGGPFIFDL